MASYFDATNDEDVALLPKKLQDDENLALLAARSEAEVIAQYTVNVYTPIPIGLGYTAIGQVPYDLGPNTAAVKVAPFIYVCLRGYAVDPTAADGYAAAIANASGLYLALKREIAGVVTYRITQNKHETGLVMENDGTKQRMYRQDAEDQWPRRFGFWLRDFDVRPVNWAC